MKACFKNKTEKNDSPRRYFCCDAFIGQNNIDHGQSQQKVKSLLTGFEWLVTISSTDSPSISHKEKAYISNKSKIVIGRILENV